MTYFLLFQADKCITDSEIRTEWDVERRCAWGGMCACTGGEPYAGRDVAGHGLLLAWMGREGAWSREERHGWSCGCEGRLEGRPVAVRKGEAEAEGGTGGRRRDVDDVN